MEQKSCVIGSSEWMLAAKQPIGQWMDKGWETVER